MKSHKKILILTTLICLLPMAAGLFLYNRLPARMPTHWNLHGEVDGYSSRAFAVFGMPCLMAGINALLQFALNTDPKSKNIGRWMKNIAFWTVPLLTLLVFAFTYSWALGYQGVPVEAVVPALVSVLFILIGNYLPKCKQNYTTGIKLPWTLSDEDNWNRTHHLAGWLWIAGGFVSLVGSFFAWRWVLFPVLAVMVGVPAVYSYLLFRKKQKQAKNTAGEDEQP